VKTFLSAARERSVVATSAKVALVVGTVLALINYGDRIFLRSDMQPLDWVKLAVTYLVPYCVATYGAARYALRQANDKPGDPAARQAGKRCDDTAAGPRP
jgi:hypothetical protein